MIRSATLDDAAAIAAIYAPIVKTTTISLEEDPPSAVEIAGRIEALLQIMPYLVAQRGSDVIGYAYASPHRQRSAYRFAVDVTVYVDETMRRSGTGKSLYEHLLADLRERKFHRAYAGIALPNDGSIGLHEALGFSHIGTYHEVGFKFGKWHDVGWWERDLTRK
ncbi:arsinothricin resistance N-acetyltransferase ArsN1 family B [Roseovarius sp. M141]|uniref:arsinothricin resistance N-acetyltransferase ArsN1 family B n=1 Tax=Roseovarius sp. M141 TaxID=2583806 RepID=UPI0020CC9B89|nr:arsinothricin resistance N-acetyltransferase ArsN1 family B [Roseovarius sp. M141]MCQ0090509.1 N-acetyltransferase family protein [Roseovarius sp. M141]